MIIAKDFIFELIIIIIMSALLIWGLVMLYDKYGIKTANELCTEQCSRFNYTFYKTESRFNIVFDCWCYDENTKPINIGSYVK